MIFKSLIIYSYSNKEVFKEYTFNECGLNVILGERKEEGQETNGVGKTTMVESINFLLGGSCPNDFKGKEALINKDIFLILQVIKDGENVFLGRLINQPDIGYVLYSNSLTFDLGQWTVKEEYKAFINNFLIDQSEKEPAFSSLREYIIRDEKKGFIDIKLPNRTPIYEAMYFAYLFGLPFDFEFDISKIKKEQKELNKKLSLINSLKNEIGDLKLKEEKINNEIRELDEIIMNVKFTEKLQRDANEYSYSKDEYNKVQNSIFELEHIKKQYEKNINDLEEKIEEIKLLNDLEPFYEQLIGYFPEDIKQNYEQIQYFYNFMVDNRGEYFRHKIENIDDQIKEKSKELNKIGNALSKKSLAFINTDIISDFSRINEEKNEKFEELAEIRVKINLYKEKSDVTSQINKLKTEVLRLTEIKQNIYTNFQNKVSEIQKLFNDFVKKAYKESGILEFELNNKTGINNSTGRIEINCQIDDEKSHGRLYMKINMFDLTWFVNGLKNEGGKVPLLIHDGSYSKPDKHAKERLLNYVDNLLKGIGKGQYFITVNIDELEQEVFNDFDKKGLIVAKLKRGNNNKDRFLGFRYTN
ncbi:DUF2326 domain-containing protein [Sutcliffiella horikoshii]|uniref:DUF2326 domain-containing protein n=1 Tax=Sutcliffiella horikoshii TaxID=79883 RepID=UPI001F2325BC|nr:DUF2326 domain-containing protein [Sutcliffiella horikoshii]MCG1024036.1 DUF2326 domain-containing protein [Sutcliffiella horikoshii]